MNFKLNTSSANYVRGFKRFFVYSVAEIDRPINASAPVFLPSYPQRKLLQFDIILTQKEEPAVFGRLLSACYFVKHYVVRIRFLPCASSRSFSSWANAVKNFFCK